ncbi:MAG: 6,7-dimethyl-8-ribityllumazine synthase [Candidatus Magasanikbacteria bacterium CG_4_9_14_0_2_um_filter_42_11]|uniref:6,7-dimethyl-8-ribityllumazine synthase n=1 Tax=Candidatus Magasanikbacteria bacterium CG_4_9_14_0_2_um_filter_42_11 TaxID=1974643 RepID=A0A2M8F9N3_9BACT|nr:MAG: 6,7-dimethyl-8-ribityllumazine synthase [Candidatus Magasanikbacteria bacterium CG10_big_fil_rev_8_21_14_0_10_43_9]PIY92854.1 MAG: 6,7-dimethyl-8-ribityllumazine synthase [Candidatus Magasanikbacteria bacterium CG_4_10_14_0_8_um_filter_42_12]PJC52445.1 MAG: 6,7-dimethyl-8-ribityllumazine synthase [Candidatus Magasanikbacteria bacterium CG_4_9_14_0_2_um_filter_42_11]
MKEIHFEKIEGKGLKIGIVVARWNSAVTYPLRDACIKALEDAGVETDHVFVQDVPGSYEVVYGAKHLIEQKHVDAVVAIGCLIKGETMHFEYIAEAVSQGLMTLNTDTSVPVIFGVLTCLTEEQATARSKGENNHGYAWGQSAIEMANLKNAKNQ